VLAPSRIALLIALLCSVAHTRAQTELDVQTFTPPAGRSAVISIPDPELPVHGTIDLGLTASWARWPLVRRVSCDAAATAIDSSCVTGDRDGQTPVVSDLAALEAAAAVALFDAMRLGVVVPLVLVRVADDPELPQRLDNHVRIGDLRLSTDVPLVRGQTALALSFVATLPTGDGARLISARNWTATPAMVVRQQLGAVALAAALGYRLRERAERIGIEHEDELDAALGLSVPLGQTLAVQAELRARAGVGGETTRANEQPVEAALGASWHAGASTTLLLGAGAGVWPGRRGYGAPNVRVHAGLRQAWAPAPCALGPEDRDGFRDHDGCLDADNDGDGVDDERDACLFDREDADGFVDGDGCPDWDDDADGLHDGHDRCPRRSEDRDGFEDGDGCPEPDNDQDGSADGADACALDPEDRDGFEDDDGCPEPGPKPVSISVGEERILVSERIYFDDDGDTIRAVSGPVLDQLAEIIRTLGPGVKVVVEGHTDDSGNAAYNLDLSHRRARAVVTYLKARGVPADRLDATGHGAARPLAPNDSPEGRALNRRVEFLLVR